MTETTTATESDLLHRAVDVARTAVDTQIRLGKEYAGVLRSVVAKDGHPVAAGKAYLESAGKEAVQYWRDVAELALGYAAGVVEVGDRAYSAVLADVTSATSTPTPVTPGDPIDPFVVVPNDPIDPFVVVPKDPI